MVNFKDWFDYRNLILNLKYDAIESTIEITIVENPETLQPQMTFEVKGIYKLSVDRFHDPDEVTMGDCEQYTLVKRNDKYQHEIKTGDAIITFESKNKFQEKANPLNQQDRVGLLSIFT